MTYVLPGQSVAQPGARALETRPPRRREPRAIASGGLPDRTRYVRLCRTTDTVAAVISLIAASLVTGLDRMPGGLGPFLAVRISLEKLLVALVFLLAWRGVLTLSGLYDWEYVGTRSRELTRAAVAGTLGSGLTLIIALDSASGAFGTTAMLDFWLIATALVLLLRGILRAVVLDAVVSRAREVIIVGSGPRAVAVDRRLSADRRSGYHVLGFVDSNATIAGDEIGGRLLGRLDQLEAILMRQPLDEVVIALPMRSAYNAILATIRVCERVGVRAKYLADVFPDSRARLRFEQSGDVAAVALPIAPEDGRLVVKRLLDIVGSLIGLIVLSPLLLVTALAIMVTSPGRAIFVQERVGINKRRFRMYKFRTMSVDAEERQASVEHLNEARGPIFKIRDDPRLTPIGSFLRKSSIDELPQLLNVLRGEMSLVGPRPMSVRDVSRFTDPGAMRRFSMHPGLTCLWQTLGRSDLSFAEWLRLDLEYIDRWSLALDLRILLRTLPAVLRGNGAA